MHYFSIVYLCNSNLFLTSPPGLFSFIFVSVLVLYIREVQFILTRFKLGLSSWRQKRLPQDHHGASSYFNCFKRKWANPGLFLFIFVLFKHIFTEKTLRLQQDSNFDRRSRRRARCDHSTTTTTALRMKVYLASQVYRPVAFKWRSLKTTVRSLDCRCWK